MRRTTAILLFALLAPSAAHADGKRDLLDGIAFYENLDTERAKARLRAALASTELGAADRARAYVYLGMVHFETGFPEEAEEAWLSGFDLDISIKAPEGASPKTIEAMEVARKKAREAPATPPPEAKPKETKPLPGVTGEPPPPAITPPPAKAEDEETNWLLWGGIGGGVVAAAVVAVILAASAGGSDECNGVPGGCLSVSYTISQR